MSNVMQNKIPIAVREGYFEAGLHIEPGTPPWIFLRCSGGAQVKSRPIRYSGDCEIFFTTHMPAPIDVLQHALLIDAKDVSDLARIQNKNFAGLNEADRRLCHRRSQAGQYNQDQTPAPSCELKCKFHSVISSSYLAAKPSEPLRAVPRKGSIVSVRGVVECRSLYVPSLPQGRQASPCRVPAPHCQAASDRQPHRHRDRSTFPRKAHARDRSERRSILVCLDSRDRSTLPAGAWYKAYRSDCLDPSSRLSHRALRLAEWLWATRNCRPCVRVDSHETSRSATPVLPAAAGCEPQAQYSRADVQTTGSEKHNRLCSGVHSQSPTDSLPCGGASAARTGGCALRRTATTLRQPQGIATAKTKHHRGRAMACHGSYLLDTGTLQW